MGDKKKERHFWTLWIDIPAILHRQEYRDSRVQRPCSKTKIRFCVVVCTLTVRRFTLESFCRGDGRAKTEAMGNT